MGRAGAGGSGGRHQSSGGGHRVSRVSGGHRIGGSSEVTVVREAEAKRAAQSEAIWEVPAV